MNFVGDGELEIEYEILQGHRIETFCSPVLTVRLTLTVRRLDIET
jgi:hypothetical protein